MDRLLPEWRVCYSWSDSTENINSENDSDFSVLAYIEAQWPYKTASITFITEMMLTQSIENIDRTIVHELCHAMLNEMREFGGNADTIGKKQYDRGCKHEERVAETLTDAIIKAYRSQDEKVRPPGEASKKRSPSKSRTKEKTSRCLYPKQKKDSSNRIQQGEGASEDDSIWA